MFTQNGLYFEIEGVPRKKKLKKRRSYVGVYHDRMEIELDGERDSIPLEDIYDIYIQEPLTEDVDCRTTVVEYYEEGEQTWYELEDATFPDLAARMENVLGRYWTHFAEKRVYPPTVRWVLACGLPYYVSAGQNPEIFGGCYPVPENTSGLRKGLYDSWGINNPGDLEAMQQSLYNGRHDSRAWDLQRLTLLSSLGYVADYISYTDALDWCLKAALALQGLRADWDEFMQAYLKGYCDWSGDDLRDEDSEACQRQRIYAFYKARPNGPYALAWDTPLSREW